MPHAHGHASTGEWPVSDRVDRTVPFRERAVLTDEDVAEILEKPVRSVQYMARAGQLPDPLFGGKSGSKRMWSAAYFFRWLDSNGKARR